MPFGVAIDSFARPFEGAYVPGFGNKVISRINKEVSAQIPFGRVVQEDAATPGNGMLLLTGPTNKFAGILGHEHSYVRDIEMGSTGLLPNAMGNVVQEGEIYVLVDEAVTPLSDVRFRVTAAGGGLGTFRATSAGAGLTVRMPTAKFATTASASTTVMLRFSFLGSGLFVAD